jgi:hypothetical protein
MAGEKAVSVGVPTSVLGGQGQRSEDKFNGTIYRNSSGNQHPFYFAPFPRRRWDS